MNSNDKTERLSAMTTSDIIKYVQSIRELASWHFDPDADPDNTSPDDNAAHINGLIVKACSKLIDGLNDS